MTAHHALVLGLARHLEGTRDKGYDVDHAEDDPTFGHAWALWAKGLDRGDFEGLAVDVLAYVTDPGALPQFALFVIEQLGEHADEIRQALANVRGQLEGAGS